MKTSHLLLGLLFITAFVISAFAHSIDEKTLGEQYDCPICGAGMTITFNTYATFKGGQKIYFCDHHSRDELDAVETWLDKADYGWAEGGTPDDAYNRDSKLDIQCPVCGMAAPSMELRDPRVSTTKDSNQFIHACSLGCASEVVANPKSYYTAAVVDGHDQKSEDDEYCVGASTMLHSGFSIKDEDVCTVLFFEDWTLDSAGKFGGACAGLFLISFLHEALTLHRRNIMRKYSRSITLQEQQVDLMGEKSTSRLYKFLAHSHVSLPVRLYTSLLYAISLAIGYFLMLAVMTYRGQMLIAIICGLALGHFVFRTDGHVAEQEDPCCGV